MRRSEMLALMFLLVALIRCGTLLVPEEPARQFEVWLDDETYYCDVVKLDGKFLTLDNCQGYKWPIDLVAGQDYTEVEVRLNE